MIAIGIGATGVPKIACVAIAIFLYAIGIPLFAPGANTILSRLAPGGRRGFVLGVDSAVTSVGRIAAPLLMGTVYELRPSCAFAAVGMVVAAAAAVMLAEKQCLSEMSKA